MTSQTSSSLPQTPELGLTSANLQSMRKWFWFLLIFGIAWRLIRWALAMPVWGDEAMVGLPIVQRSYLQLLEPLGSVQVAPVLWLWAERFMYELTGMGERSMRAPSLIAGVAALILFWRWSRLLVDQFAACAATGILAVGFYVVRHGTELKPYSFDLCAAMLLLLPATHLLLTPRKRWLALLIFLTPLAMLCSYPSIFVAGGIWMALFVWALTEKKILPWISLLLLGPTLLVSFYAVLHIFGNKQYDDTSSAMIAYWKEAFPPANPLQFVIWFVKTHTGNLFAYPVGGKYGASAGTLILFLIGLLGVWQRMPAAMSSRRGAWLALLLTPFALTFIAAAMRRYPYGESARVSQHLAPAIMLLTGLGISAAVQRLAKTEKSQRQSIHAVLCLTLLVGLIGLFDNLLHPYKTREDQIARNLIRQPFQNDPDSRHQPIALLQSDTRLWPNYRWYVKEIGTRLVLQDAENNLPALQELLKSTHGSLQVISLADTPASQAALAQLSSQITTQTDPYYLQIGPRQGPKAYFRAYRFQAQTTQPASNVEK